MARSTQSIFTKIYWKTRRSISYLAFGGNNKVRKYTLLILLFYGLAGTIIDLDHLIIAQTEMARPLHLPYFIIIWTICICYYAYIHRRVHKSSIKNQIACFRTISVTSLSDVFPNCIFYQFNIFTGQIYITEAIKNIKRLIQAEGRVCAGMTRKRVKKYSPGVEHIVLDIVIN